MRRVLVALVEQNVRVNLGFYTGLLAELEAETLGADSALARIDEAFRLSNQVEHGCSLPFLHRLRGEILFKRSPTDRAPAEEAFRASIAIAKEQSARSPVLLASLALAKLYQATSRVVEAHAILAPALEGFAPTPEMPEIAEAQALLAALAETAEVKAEAVQRERRLRLQTSYGQAVMYSKGFVAEETKAAFARAAELAANTGAFSERFAAAHGQWTSALVGGQLKSARELASAFLREAETLGRVVEVGVASRGLAIISYWLGEFSQTRIHCERALALRDPERDREARERFSEDTGLIAMSWLALSMWQLGEVERAREVIERVDRAAAELGHAPSMAHPLQAKFFLEFLRRDAAAALAAAEGLEALGRNHELTWWRDTAHLHVICARARLHEPVAGVAELRAALAALEGRGTSMSWSMVAQLAELELQTLGPGGALARIDAALALARQVEHRSNLPFAHLVRGEILFALDGTHPAPAEDAFRTALAIAAEQDARSWGLRAALSLAKLYQSTSRPVDAHAVLAPAPEGFSPTPEMPEIAEARALLAALGRV